MKLIEKLLGSTSRNTSTSRRKRRRSSQAALHSATMESLESRILMSTLVWTGGASGTWDNTTANWKDFYTNRPASWSAGDDAIFWGQGNNAVTISGTIQAGSVEFAAPNYTLTGGTLQCTSLSVDPDVTLTLGGATVSATGTSVSSGAALALSSATLTTNTVSTSGTFTVGSGGTLNLSSASLTGTITNQGTVHWASTDITALSQVSNSGTVVFDSQMSLSTISLPGTYELANGDQSTSGLTIGRGTTAILGGGTFDFSSGGVTNNGTLVVNGGALTTWGFTSNGDVRLEAGSISGVGNSEADVYGNFTWTGGDLDVGSAYMWEFGSLSIAAAGKSLALSGGGIVTADAFSWTGGNVTSTADLAVQAGTFVLDGHADTFTLNGASLTPGACFNDIEWDSGTLKLINGASIVNCDDYYTNVEIPSGHTVTLDISSDSMIIDHLFNSGTLHWASENVAQLSQISNTGTVVFDGDPILGPLSGGAYEIDGDAVNNGGLSISAGTTLTVVGSLDWNTSTLTPLTNITNDGTVIFDSNINLSGITLTSGKYQVANSASATSGSLIISSTATLSVTAGTATFKALLNYGTLNLLGGTLDFVTSSSYNESSGSLLWTGGELDLDAGLVNHGDLHIDGGENVLTLNGSGAGGISNWGTLEWTSGDLTIGGIYGIFTLGQISLDAPGYTLTLNAVPLETYNALNSGAAVTWTAGNLALTNGASLINDDADGATFTIPAAAEVTLDASGGSIGGTISNQGTLHWTGTDMTYLPNVSNTGTVIFDGNPTLVSLSGNSTATEGSAYTLTIGSVSPDIPDTIADYYIEWGDGLGCDGPNPLATSDSYTYGGSESASTTYTILLDLFGTSGVWLNASYKTVTVADVAPVVTLDDPGTTSTTPTITGSAGISPGDASTATIKIYSGSSASGTPVFTDSVDVDPNTGLFSYALADADALSPGTHTVQATQTEEAGNTGTSDPVTFTIDLAQPAPVSGLTATPRSDSEIDLAWDPAPHGDFVSSFSVHVSTDGGESFSPYADTADGSSTTVAVTGLDEHTPYIFDVLANNAATSSPDELTPETYTLNGLSAPVLATPTAGGTSGYALSWTGSSTSVNHFLIQARYAGNDQFATIQEVDSGTTSFATGSVGIWSSDTVVFRVGASDGEQTVYSNEVTGTANPSSFMNNGDTTQLHMSDNGTHLSWTQTATRQWTFVWVRKAGTVPWTEFDSSNTSFPDRPAIPENWIYSPGGIQVVVETLDHSTTGDLINISVSNIATEITHGSTPSPVITSIIPATIGSTHGAILFWTSSGDDVSYTIYDPEADYQSPPTDPAIIPYGSIVASGNFVPLDASREYVVVATNSTGTSAPSNVAKLPSGPTPTIQLGTSSLSGLPILTSAGGMDPDDMVPLTYSIPPGGPTEGASLAISAEAATEIVVWDTPNPTEDDTPVLGGPEHLTSATIMLDATDLYGGVLWVGATSPSGWPGDIQFTLGCDEPVFSAALTAKATAVQGTVNVYLDGTNNRGERDARKGTDTNVYKMFLANDDDLASKIYEAGVGTGGITGGLPDGLVRGITVTPIENDAWAKLIEDLNAGARTINIIGFSRGSSEALDLANRIEVAIAAGTAPFGPNPFRGLRAANINFLGVYDPVDSINAIPNNPGTLNLGVPSGINHVAEAVALSENRVEFGLIDLTGSPNTEVMGFLGCHADIGGGYLPNSAGASLAYTALHWMMNDAMEFGMTFTNVYSSLTDSYNPADIHDSWADPASNYDFYIEPPSPRTFLASLPVYINGGVVRYVSQLATYWNPDLAVDQYAYDHRP